MTSSPARCLIKSGSNSMGSDGLWTPMDGGFGAWLGLVDGGWIGLVDDRPHYWVRLRGLWM